MEERLRRMEEAYLRMEEHNRRIQAQYSTLLQKYDDLSRKITTTPTPAEASPPIDARLASQATTMPRPETMSGTSGRQLADLLGVVPAETVLTGYTGEPFSMDPGLDPQAASDAQGTGGRTGIRQQGRSTMRGAAGEIGRGTAEDEGAAPFRSRLDRIGAGAEGTGGRTSPTQQPTVSGPRARGESGAYTGKDQGDEGTESRAPGATDLKPKRHPGHFAFGEGLEFESDDDEFKLQFHDLTQAEFRGFDNRDLGVLKDQFFIPRQRWYFVGDLTKNVGFYTSINRGYGSLDLLDAFITLRFSNALRFRIGRMKTPYLYEYFSIAEGDLIAPERSMFATNLSLNRQNGFMFLGELFDNSLSYATGLFNGPRRSFQNLNSAFDSIGTLTWRPFLKSDRFRALNYLNIGGSWDVGYQDNYPPQPINFGTAADQTPSVAAQYLSPTFLSMNANARELGMREQWGGHVVWYYKSFFLLAEYGGAREGFGVLNQSRSVPVNMNGIDITTSYFITGEQVTRRVNMVKPIRDFNFNFLKPGQQFSPGAVELIARYSNLSIGRDIFTGGFANPNLWSNNVWATDIGLNWYLNFYTRIFLDWQHAEFGSPVSTAPGKFTSFTDLYWLRFQIFF